MLDDDDTLNTRRGDTPTPVEVPTATFTTQVRPRPSRRLRVQGSTPPGGDVSAAATVIEAVPSGALVETSSGVTRVTPAPTPAPVPIPPPSTVAPPAAAAPIAGPRPPLLPSRSLSPSPVTSAPGSPSLTGAALREDEAQRTRNLVLVNTVLAIPSAAITPLLGVEASAERLLWASTAVFVLANLLLLLAGRVWTAPRLVAVWFSGVCAALGSVFVYGLQSGALILPTLGLYVIALGQHRWIARGSFLMFAIGHATLIALCLTGHVRDRGLVSTRSDRPEIQLVLEASFLCVLVAAYVHARASRRTSVRSLRQLEAAVTTIGEREAQLHEVHQDLEHSMRLGDEGRWSHQVLGSFRLGAVIGRGAVGEVYAGHHVTTGEPAAVKLLQVETAEVPGNLARFEREARAAASLRSAHVVRVLEVSVTGAPVPYLAMELLQGTDLSGYLRAKGRLPLHEVVELAWQLAAGLEVARLVGVVHRDLKPQNVFRAVDERGAAVWKILDFGVSKLADGAGTLTHGHLIGTPHYMSPEQAAGRETDHRSDVYALAALCYRCLTGRPPFAGIEMPALIFHVVHEVAPRVGLLVRVPAIVDSVLACGLAKRPDQRYWTAVELAAALGAAVRR